MKPKPKNWVILCNGGYFDGLAGGRPLEHAKRFYRHEARILNRVIMCGKGTLVFLKGAKP